MSKRTIQTIDYSHKSKGIPLIKHSENGAEHDKDYITIHDNENEAPKAEDSDSIWGGSSEDVRFVKEISPGSKKHNSNVPKKTKLEENSAPKLTFKKTHPLQCKSKLTNGKMSNQFYKTQPKSRATTNYSETLWNSIGEGKRLKTSEIKCNGGNNNNKTFTTSKQTDNTTTLKQIEIEDSEDDDIIVLSSTDDHLTMPYTKLKSIVMTICSNLIKEGEVPNAINAKKVIIRLKSVYHKDFTGRLKEINYIIKKNKSDLLQNEDTEIRPGLLKSDMNTLNPGEWLNDVIINSYLEILTHGQKNYISFDSFLYDGIRKGANPCLDTDWENVLYALVPVCLSSHWMLLAYNTKTSEMEMYNSMAVSLEEFDCAKVLMKYFSTISNGKTPKIKVIERAPRQENAFDCGVYVCMFARCIVCGNDLQFHPGQVKGYREWMQREIINKTIITIAWFMDFFLLWIHGFKQVSYQQVPSC